MRVLLLDLGWPQTLWFLPPLRKAGATVVLAVCGGADDRFLGRYCAVRSLPRLADPRFDSSLRTEIEAGGYGAVVAMSDDLIEACWRVLPDGHDAVWPHVDPQYREVVRNRAMTDRLIRQLLVPVPGREEITDGTLAQALARIGLPCVVRGTQGCGGSQVRIARDEAEAHIAFTELSAVSPSRPYLQQFVPGPTHLVGGLFERGEARQWFALEKLEVYPPGTGPSIRCRSIHALEEIHYAERIFRTLSYNGLGFVEFIRPPTGPPLFIEFNPRSWGSIRAAASSGIDFLDLAARQISGAPSATPVTYKSGTQTVLFPQFIGARLRAQRSRFNVAEFECWLRSLRAAPWSEPSLMLRFVRGLWWEFVTRSRAQVATPPRAYAAYASAARADARR